MEVCFLLGFFQRSTSSVLAEVFVASDVDILDFNLLLFINPNRENHMIPEEAVIFHDDIDVSSSKSLFSIEIINFGLGRDD